MYFIITVVFLNFDKIIINKKIKELVKTIEFYVKLSKKLKIK